MTETMNPRATLSRRDIAAISFLANIKVKGEPEGELPGLKCLVGTRTLQAYRESLPRNRGKEKGRDRANTVSCAKGTTPELGERLPLSKRRSGEGEGIGSTKRKLVYQHQVSEGGAGHLQGNSSSESLIQTQAHQGSGALVECGNRMRQLSGTLSEKSNTSSVCGREAPLGRPEVAFIRPEAVTEQLKLSEERLVFVSSGHKAPLAVTSVISFSKSSKNTRAERFGGDVGRGKLRHTSGSRQLHPINDTFDPFELLGLERSEAGQEISYCHLLEPSYISHDDSQLEQEGDISNQRSSPPGGRGRGGSPRMGRDRESPAPPPEPESGWGHPTGIPYSAHSLDGWLGAGKHRKFLPFPSYITSVIEYVKPSDMKKELNEKFSSRFPAIQISLSKLRSIKTEMRRIAMECTVDTVTTAQAYVYFEKLVLKKIINKANRKFCAGASLILAAKLNDIKGEQLKNLIEKTESIFRLNRRDLLASEFAILVALEFSLHIPNSEVYPHYQRLLYQT